MIFIIVEIVRKMARCELLMIANDYQCIRYWDVDMYVVTNMIIVFFHTYLDSVDTKLVTNY